MGKKATDQDLAHDYIKVRGMFRINITQDGDIVGDSGWRKNQITNSGSNNGFVECLGGVSGSSQITYAALGTGTAPGASATTLNGEVSTNASGSVVRAAITAASSSNSSALVCTATFSSANSFITASVNISNIGLFQSSGPTTAAGVLYMGNTYTSSALATNQNVNVTYQVNFSP